MRPNCASACFCSNPWIRFPIHMHAAGYPPGGVFFAHHHHRTPGARLHTARSYAGQGHHTTQTRARVGANAGRSARSANGWGWIIKQFQTTWGKIAVLQKFPKTLASSGTSRALPSGRAAVSANWREREEIPSLRAGRAAAQICAPVLQSIPSPRAWACKCWDIPTVIRPRSFPARVGAHFQRIN